MSSAFARTNFHARYDEAVEIDFRVGAPPAKILGGSGWQDALTRWSRRCIEIPRGHNNPAGLLELRQQIAKWLRQQRHLECDEENIFILSGAQQARNLICRLFVDQNTPVAFEEPGSLFARLCLESYGATIIPIHVDGSGLVTSELTQCVKPIPKILYLTPSAQFPTGAILSRSRRTQVAKWAQENNSLIIEDDNNCEFTYDSRQSAAVYSFAPERTIYIGTFSQLLEPSWRVSYLVLPRSMREPFYRLKWLSDRCSSPLVQELVLELMESGFLRRHLKKAQKSCEQRREIMLKELEKFPADLIQFSPTKGGLHQAVWFPSRVNDIEIFSRCFEKNVGVLPLSPYFAGNPAAPGILLNFSSLDEAQMKEGMNRIATVLEDAYGS